MGTQGATGHSHTFDRPHTPISIAGNPISYDANGNMTVRMNGSAIIYDAENRPVDVNAGAVTYKYGPRSDRHWHCQWRESAALFNTAGRIHVTGS